MKKIIHGGEVVWGCVTWQTIEGGCIESGLSSKSISTRKYLCGSYSLKYQAYHSAKFFILHRNKAIAMPPTKRRTSSTEKCSCFIRKHHKPPNSPTSKNWPLLVKRFERRIHSTNCPRFCNQNTTILQKACWKTVLGLGQSELFTPHGSPLITGNQNGMYLLVQKLSSFS